MRCDRVRFYLDALVDGELGQIRRWAVVQHIRGCAACAAELDLARRLTRQAREWRSVEAPPHLKGRIAAAVGGIAARPYAAQPEPVRTRRIIIPRRVLVAAVPATLAGVATVVLARRGQADPLRQTLDAMARVRSARASGYAIGDPAVGHPGDAGRAELEYLYLAPDRYRKMWGPGARSGGVAGGTLIVRGYEGIFIPADDPEPGKDSRIEEADVRESLSHFDLFTRDGFLARAASEHRTHTQHRRDLRDGIEVEIVDVQVDEESRRRRWVLITDTRTRRVIGSEHEVEIYADGRWVPRRREVLHRFDYDPAVDPAELELSGTTFPR